jgi:thiamine kinase-like enzyme
MAAAHAHRLDAALATWRSWPLSLQAPPRPIEEVAGGLTNRNVRLQAPGLDQDLLLRLNHPQSQRLGIDRRLERDVIERVSDAGLGRPFLYWDPEQRFAVFPWLDARPWTREDFRDPAQGRRLRPLVEALQAMDVTRPPRRYHAYVGAYWHQLVAAGAVDRSLEAAWQDFEPAVRAFDQADWTPRWVHHDLTPANVLDSGDRLWLIDWEYADVGHPDIDRWSIDRSADIDPFVAELMGWIDRLWEGLVRQGSGENRPGPQPGLEDP